MPKLKAAKKEAFCQEYLRDLNGTKAAVRAGYSEHTARQIAAELMAQDEVQERIQELMDARSQRTAITSDKVLRELARIGFGDARNVMKWGADGMSLKESDELSEDDAAMISEITETTTQHGGSMRVKLHDKLGALDKIGRHLKLFTDVSDVNLNANVTQMGRIQAETVDAAGNVIKKTTLKFNVGSPADNAAGDDEYDA